MALRDAESRGEGLVAESINKVAERLHVSIATLSSDYVNTACSECVATLCSMNEEKVRKEQGERLGEARVLAGYRSAREAALAHEWPESTYRAHENGTRTIGLDDATRYARAFRRPNIEISAGGILFGAQELAPAGQVRGSVIPVVALIGAGGSIETEWEQQDSPLYDISIPFALDDGVIGFEIRGPSMWPVYDDGDVVCVSRFGEPVESLLGFEAAIRTREGNRFFKRVVASGTSGLYDLESYNAKTIRRVDVAWSSGLIARVPAARWRKVNTGAVRKTLKRARKVIA